MVGKTKSPYFMVDFPLLGFKHRPNPSDAQKKSGNYKKPRVVLLGWNIDIENIRGQVRSGVDVNGVPWKSRMFDHYGYFVDTYGKDGDEVDVFINGKATREEINNRPIFTVKQVDVVTGEYDEDKVVLGAENGTHARAIYMRNYGLDWRGLSAIREVSDLEYFLSSSECRTY